MRRKLAIMVVAVIAATAAPASAGTKVALDGPAPAIWLSDPDGVDGDAGIEQGDPIDGVRGRAVVVDEGARIKVRATGLEPGHAYTLWIVYFNDHDACIDGCNGPDLAVVGGGVILGDGAIANNAGRAVFRARLATGDGSAYIGETPPPPFAFAGYEATATNEFHVVVRSHGPVIASELVEQLTTFGGGCDVEVGGAPGEQGDFPVPAAEGECGDVQLYVFK